LARCPHGYSEGINGSGASIAEVLGVVGFFLSLVLALIKVRETFFLRPKWAVTFKYMKADRAHLICDIANQGSSKGTLREIRFQTLDDPEGPHAGRTYQPLLDALPKTWDVEESWRFGWRPHHDEHEPLEAAKRAGLLRCVVLEDSRGKCHHFPIPAPPAESA